jgi:putative peptidoglycan lipid II flippase
VLGFIRDAFMATMLGAGPVADAFIVAFRLPNLFRRLFAEGAFSAAFVPLFGRALAEGGEARARSLAEEVLAVFLLALVAITVVAELAAPLLVMVLAPGFLSDPDKVSHTEALTRIMFPYLACMSLTAMAAGMLQSFGRFAVAAFAPSLLNVVLVAALGLIWWWGWAGTPEAAYTLAWAVFLAGFLQLLAVAGTLWWIGFPVSLRRPRVTPDVRRMLVLARHPRGDRRRHHADQHHGRHHDRLDCRRARSSWLYYADRLYQLPLGVDRHRRRNVVLLPEMVRQLKEGDARVGHTQNRAIELAMLFTLPAAVALIVLPQAIIGALFERGAFTANDTRQTAAALAAYSIGLPAFVLQQVLSRGFFAREDTATPMKLAVVSMIVNVAGSLALFPLFGHVGLQAARLLGACSLPATCTSATISAPW